MKKGVVFFLLCLFFLSGCGKKDLKVEEYYKLVNYLEENVDISSTNSLFQMDLSFSKVTEDEVQYRFVIDDVTTNIYDIQALIVHDFESDDVFPSIGIFDDKVTLEVGKIPKGIFLVGYLPFSLEIEELDVNFKVYLSYTLENGVRNEEIYEF